MNFIYCLFLIIFLAWSSIAKPNTFDIGKHYLIAVDENGAVYIVGNNNYKSSHPLSLLVHTSPFKVEELSNIVSVAAGLVHSLALDADGRLFAWGHNEHGELGIRTHCGNLPRLVPDLSKIRQVVAAGEHSLALDEFGRVFGFGNNCFHALGFNASTNVTGPALIEGLPDVVIFIATGTALSVAIDLFGAVWIWGENIFGTIAMDRITSIPKAIPHLPPIISIAVGERHCLFLDKEGFVHSFGDNLYGQLGQIDVHYLPEPRRIETLKDIQAIAAGAHHSLAVDNNGSLRAFGNNLHKQVSPDDARIIPVPKVVENTPKIVDVRGFDRGTLALSEKGELWLFGEGPSPQLGKREKPVKIKRMPKIKDPLLNATHNRIGPKNAYKVAPICSDE